MSAAIDAAIKRAALFVESLPLWKRGILRQSASPTVSEPRKPIHKGPLCRSTEGDLK